MDLNSFGAPEIHQYVADALDWQNRLDVTAVLSPTVVVDDLQGPWASIASSLARASIAQHKGERPLLISLVVGESALRQTNHVSRWIDGLGELEAAGFYLIVRRDSEDYRQHFEATALASLLRVCHSLGSARGYKVVVGYSDMVTLLLHAVGVTSTGAGWYSNLRQFNMTRFEKRRGGRAKSRYSSLPLLNSIFMTELEAVYRGAGVGTVLSRTPWGGRFNSHTAPSQVYWPLRDAALHHWHVLTAISNLPQGASITTRLDAAQAAVQRAVGLYQQLGSPSFFTPSTDASHLNNWSDALARFRAQSGL